MPHQPHSHINAISPGAVTSLGHEGILLHVLITLSYRLWKDHIARIVVIFGVGVSLRSPGYCIAFGRVMNLKLVTAQSVVLLCGP